MDNNELGTNLASLGTEAISRQSVIDAVRAALLSWSFMPEWRDNKIIEAVEQLPPIQHVNNSEVPNSSDVVSRQTAIDALNRESRCGAVIDHCGLETAIDIISELPPAPPEIIHCKDCGHRDDHGCCKYWKALAIGDVPIATDDNDFCSHARRREREH